MITNFYTKPENVDRNVLRIEGEEAKHIVCVLRYKVGDLIDVVDGCGNRYKVSISNVGRDNLEGRILSQVRKENEPVSNLTLAQSICKGARMDWVVEKCVEVGVNNIIPLLTQGSEIHFKSPLQESIRIERWKRVAISSMKQSLRSFLPRINAVTKLGDLLENIKQYDLALMASLEKGAKRLGDLMEFERGPKNILLLVGPEVGFSSDELEASKEKGIIPVCLGVRRLRTETAGILFSALVLHQLKDLA